MINVPDVGGKKYSLPLKVLNFNAFGRKSPRLKLSGEIKGSIEAIAIDMWDPYIASITEHVPNAKTKIVFDKFHLISNYSKVIDKVRNIEYAKAAAKDKEVIKGTKYLLLRNADRLKKEQKQQLQDLLGLNEKRNCTTT